MFIDAKVIHVGTTEEKEIRIRIRAYVGLGQQLEEDFCWITKDMLKEVLGCNNEQTKDCLKVPH